MKSKLLFNSQRGISLLYVMAALIVAGFIGSGLMKMSHHSAMAGTLYEGSESARSAVNAGFYKGISILEAVNVSGGVQGNDKILAQLQAWVDADGDIDQTFLDANSWLTDSDGNGSPDNGWVTLSNNQKYRAQIIGFSYNKLAPAPFDVAIRAEGIGAGGSSGSAVGSYRLGGIKFGQFTKTDWDDENALYLGDDIDFYLLGAVEVIGNTYMGSGVKFHQNSTGSIFDGKFRSGASDTKIMNIQGKYTFKGPAYFGTKLRTNGSSSFDCRDLAGFEHGITFGGSYNRLDLRNKSYWHGNADAENPNSGNHVDFHMNRIMRNSELDFNSTNSYTWYWHEQAVCVANNYQKTQYGFYFNEVSPPSWRRDTYDGDMDIEDSLGFTDEVCEVVVDTNVILSKARTLSSLGVYSYSIITGKKANSLWETVSGNNPNSPNLWNGFLVIKLDQKMNLGTMNNDEDFKYKIIVIGNGNEIAPGSPAPYAGQMFSTTSGANFTILATQGTTVSNIGGWGDYYRGFIWVDATSTFVAGGSTNELDNFYGAIHALKGGTVKWYPKNTEVATITYVPKVLEELDYAGFLGFPEGCNGNSGQSQTTGILEMDNVDNITTTLLSRTY